MLSIQGPIAVINAGWQERESDDAELLGLLNGRGINLHLHGRWMSVLHDDSEYARAEREHRIVLGEMQQLYRIQLRHALASAYEIAQQVDRHPRTRSGALDDAMTTLRAIDAMHLDRVREARRAFDDAWQPVARETVAKQRHQVKDILAQAECLCVAGGHVGDLLHLLRLFDVSSGLPATVIAWSAGAMALTDRVVLFHDRAAQGPAPAEVLDSGMGRVRDLVALPHARRRLQTDDPVRMTVFAQRFAGARCLVLDDGVSVTVEENGSLPPDARVVATDGRIVPAADT